MPHRRSATRALILPAALVCLIVGVSHALADQVEAASVDSIPETLLSDDSEWYGLYIQDTKVGYLHRERERIEATGGPRIELRDEFRLQTVVLGSERSMTITDRMLFEGVAPFRMLEAESETAQSDDVRIVRIRSAEEGLTAEVCEAGDCRPHPFEVDEYTLGEAMAPEVWVLGQPEPGTTIAADSLLIGELRRGRDVLTLEGYETTVLDGLPVRHARVRFEEQQTGLAGDLLIADDGRWLAGTLSGTFEVRLESRRAARRLDDTTDLFVAQAVGVDRALGDPAGLSRVTMEVDLDQDPGLPSTPRQGWSCKHDGACRLTLGAGGDPLVPQDDVEIEDALASTVRFPADLTQVQEMATAVAEGVTDRARQVELLTAHVADFIDDSYSAEPLSISDLIDDPRGDCTEHAMLFITLARSLGIAAREVHGLLYIGDAGQSFGGHAWAEVLLDGEWVEIDPTWNQMPPDAGHIRLGHRLGDSSERQAALAGKTLRVVGIEQR